MTEIAKKILSLSPEKRALLESRLLQKAIPAVPKSRDQDSEIELSFAQESLWFLDRLEPNHAFYNIPTAWMLPCALDAEALRRSLEKIVERHEVLRTSVTSINGKPAAKVASNPRFNLLVIDLANFSEAEKNEKVHALIDEEARRPFDLENDLMLRASLLRLDERNNILLLTMHHIAADLWSFTVLHQELRELYDSFAQGRVPSLPDLRVKFSDFAKKQKSFLTSNSFQKQLAYWKEQLGGTLPDSELPADFPRPETQNFCGARVPVQINERLCGQLKRFSQQEGATLFITLLSAFQALIHRFSGETDIVIGSPIGTRANVEWERLIGYFLNTLPLRIKMSGEMTFRELVRRSKTVVLDAFANQDVPFEKIVSELRIPRSTNRNPIFQTIFQFQATGVPELQLAGTSAQPLPVQTGTSKMDLIFTLAEQRGCLVGDIEFNTGLFEAATIQRLLANFSTLLDSIIASPDETISQLNILSTAERKQLLDWTQTRTDYPREKTIVQLFEEQAARTPDAVALVFESQQMSYRELNLRAGALASHLRRAGVQRGSLVGVALDRSFEMIITLIAILKAGGAYVPVDSNLPNERLKFMIEDAGISYFVSDKEFDLPSVQVISPTPCSESENLEQAPSNFSPGDIAYVMFTSGSTGKPKGVSIPNRAVVRLVKETSYLQFRADETFLQLAPASFDASTLEIWGSLLNGAKLVIFPPQLPSLETLGAALREHQITTLWLTAGLFHQMVDERIDDLRGVKNLLAGGDVLSVPHVKKVLAQLPHCQLINGYGPTENTTFTCCFQIPKNWNGCSVPIGKPISNTQVYVLDEQFQMTPIGVPGELFIGGDGLAKEYLNRPELNREKFVRSPFDPAQRLYKTGDKARWLNNGTIEFLGRVDNQVKIRGFRVELEEIEACLAQHPLVRQAVVIAHTNSRNEKELAAYFTADPTKAPVPSELRSFLKTKLPAYMVPSRFMLLESFSLTTNGKVDRRALRSPDNVDARSEVEVVEPRNETEQRLLEIWRELLGRNHFGVCDNFFELGGHSLLATQVVSRIAQKFQVEFTLQKIFECPTIESLARAVNASSQSNARPILARRNRTTDKPATSRSVATIPIGHDFIDAS